MAALRFIVVFLLGIGFALVLYYGGGMQWFSDRWSGYSPAPYPPPVTVVETPVPAPVAAYPGAPGPGVLPGTTPVGPPAPYPNGDPGTYANGSDVPLPPPNGENYSDDDDSDYAPPPGLEPTYTPPGVAPPVGVAPIGNGPPLSLHISIGHRGYGAGCEPAYTVFNDTSRPILLTERSHYRWHGRGPKDAFIVQPGERQVACAADVYQARDGYPRFDYYRQNVHYGPDAIDLPPPVNIRVKE